MSDYPYISHGPFQSQSLPRTQPWAWPWLTLLSVALAVFLTTLVKSKGLAKHGFSFGFIAWCGGRRVTLHLTTEMKISQQHEDEDEENVEGEKKEGKKEANFMQKKREHRRTKSYPALDRLLLRKDSSFSCLLGTKMILCIEKSPSLHPSRSNPSLYFSPPHEIPILPLVTQEITHFCVDDSVKFQHAPWPLLETPRKTLICEPDLPLLGSSVLQFPTFEQQFGFDRTPPWGKPSLPCPSFSSSPLIFSANQQKLLKFCNIYVDFITSLSLRPSKNQASIGLANGKILIWDVEKAMAISRAVSLLDSPISSLLMNKLGNRSIISGKMGVVEQWDERISTQPVSSWSLFEPHRDDPITNITSKGGQELICTSNSISYKLDLRMPKHKAIEVFMNGKLLLDEHSVLDVLDSLLFLLPHHDEDEEDCTCETQEQNKRFFIPDESGSFLSRCAEAIRALSFEYHRS